MSARLQLPVVLAFCLGAWAGGPPEDLRKSVPHRITKATSDIKIDGVLEEQAWKDALKLELKYEVRPAENLPPPVKTEMFLAFSDTALLIAFRAHDPDPSKIRARYNDRDSSFQDDFVGVVLDTFNDERRAYELLVNPLGAQIDAINDEVGDNYDTSWNAIWDSAGKITDSGYEVEMRIPFNQLRFQPQQGPQTWGLDGIRSYPRTDKHHIGLFPRERGNNSYLSQEEKMIGFEGADPGRNLEIVPTVVSSRTDVRDDAADGLVNGDQESELGLTARWGVTPNLTLNATVNPDFSTIEADSVRLGINEQFAIFFPETRPFFLEGADYFNTGMRLVHTRTIANPSAALKTTGKVGNHTFGAFIAQDDVTNVIVPGSEGSSSGTFDHEVTSSVARYRYDFGKNSTVGALMTDKQGQDGYYNRVLSLDARWKITDRDSLNVNAVGTQTQYSDEMREELEIEDPDEISDASWSVNYRHSRRNWNVRAYHEDRGKDFRADVGFIPQVDFYKTVIGGGYNWFPKERQFIRRFNSGGDWDETRTQDGDLIEEEIEGWFEFQLPYETWTGLGTGSRTRVFEGVSFDQKFYRGWFNMQPSRDLRLNFNFNIGDWIDFTHVREADRLRLGGSVRYNMGKHVRLVVSHNHRTLDVDEGNLFTTKVTEGRINYHFNRRTMIRLIAQNVDIERNTDLYADNRDNDPDNDVDAATRDLFAQLLFSYKMNAQTVAYVGYTDSYYSTDEVVDLTQLERTLFVKFGYAWTR
ncbi:MAG: carbohydrate binding family 9 domain-containing protein [Acidobacteriota bacterium]|nr:carbohydrate binding family 9 domain-containing protein [Acidobacteriota bacterium]